MEKITGLSLELGGGLLYVGIRAKGYKPHITSKYANFRHTQLTHTNLLQTQRQSPPQVRKWNSPPLKHCQSLKRKQVEYTSNLGSIIAKLIANCLPIACFSTTRSMTKYRLERSLRSSLLSSHFHACIRTFENSQNLSIGHNSMKFPM